jgi:hypothetical protein
LNYQFKDSGASQYDPDTNTATINVKSTNPIKALVAHETLHHTIIKNNMESGISALFLGDMKENTVGGLFRSRDGKLDPNFEAFKDAYYKRLGVAEMSNAERDAIYPLDKVAVEYFIEKHSDQYSAMAESGELGAIASSGAARRKLGSILETILPRVPVLRDLHFKSGGMIDKNGSWVTGNGILDAEGVKTDPITNKMFRDMNRRSAGLATGQFEPLISDKADSGASIILNPSDSIDSELLHPLVKTDENGKPILENGRAVALDKATELERALAGLTVNEVLRRKRSENYVPEKGEAYIDDNNQFQSGWLPDDVVSEMFAKNRFNPEQKRIIREMNRLVKKGTGDRVVMINFPATTRNKSGKAVYKPQGATLRDTVPVAILTSKDGNLLFGLMSVTKLQENIQKRSQSARGKRLYSGNVDLILRDTQAMMDFHKNGVDSIEYFSEKYGAVEADQRKKFINTMFGLLNQKEQAVLNPMLLEDGVKSRDNVYRTYRADRVSKAVPMSPQDYPAMPFSYKATSQVLLPEQVRKMPEAVDKEYMMAVKAGDREAQQRLVDEAAKKAGLVEVFRAVRGQTEKITPREGYQVTFTTRKEVADSYGETDADTSRYFIDPRSAQEFPSKNGDFSKTGFDKKVQSGNLIVARAVYDNGPFASLERDPKMMFSYPSDIYATIDASVLVKSSDPVIYDNSGKVIPLSQRFPESVDLSTNNDRIFYRGTTAGDARRINEPFSAAKGMTFAARNIDSAKTYGNSIEKITAKPNARILREEDPAFWRVINRKRPSNGYIGSAGRKGESMVDVINDSIKKAKDSNYDILSFASDTDIGTIILNNNAVLRKSEPLEQARQMPESQSQVEDTTVDDRLKLLQTKEVLQDWAMTQESWKDWYSEHQETLDDFFGDNAELFQEILAVTSQAASVKANVGLALKAFGQLMRGEEFDARLRGEEKAGYLPAVIGNLNAIKNKTQVGGRKISNYKSANEGDSSKVVVDRHIARMLFGVDTPSAKQYAEAERVLTDIAKELGWKPAQVQAALWAQSIVMSGKTPVSYGSYLRQLESKGLTKKELINGIKGNQITRRTGEIAGSSYGRDATSKERGRYSPSVQDASGGKRETVSYLPESEIESKPIKKSKSTVKVKTSPESISSVAKMK